MNEKISSKEELPFYVYPRGDWSELLVTCPNCDKPIVISNPDVYVFKNLRHTRALLLVRCFECNTETIRDFSLSKADRVRSALSLRNRIRRVLGFWIFGKRRYCKAK